jgi:hypothetical protein
MKSGSEAENVIEAKKEITDENSSENSSKENRYCADKAGKHCRNCNSTNGSETENVIETKKKITDENSSEDSSEENRYCANKIGKHCRNCNSIFGSGNKLYQYLRFEIACII